MIESPRAVLKLWVGVAYEVKRLAILSAGCRSREQIGAVIHQLGPGEAKLELQTIAEAFLHFGHQRVVVGVYVVGSIVEAGIERIGLNGAEILVVSHPIVPVQMHELWQMAAHGALVIHS